MPLSNGTHKSERPQKRADCIDGPRPCPWVSCRHHLALVRISKMTGEPTMRSVEGKASCTLDVVDDHAPAGMGLNQIAAVLGVSRQAVDVTVKRALAKLEKRGLDT